MSGKKLINDPDSTVDEALSGLVASRHNLALIEGRRVVVVKDLADVKGRVAVVCGGGSGSEKYFILFSGSICTNNLLLLVVMQGLFFQRFATN